MSYKLSSMGVSPRRRWIQHLVIIFVAIKTALYVKRNWRTKYEVDPIEVKSGLGPVKNKDNTYNILNKVRIFVKQAIVSIIIV